MNAFSSGYHKKELHYIVFLFLTESEKRNKNIMVVFYLIKFNKNLMQSQLIWPKTNAHDWFVFKLNQRWNSSFATWIKFESQKMRWITSDISFVCLAFAGMHFAVVVVIVNSNAVTLFKFTKKTQERCTNSRMQQQSISFVVENIWSWFTFFIGINS